MMMPRDEELLARIMATDPNEPFETALHSVLAEVTPNPTELETIAPRRTPRTRWIAAAAIVALAAGGVLATRHSKSTSVRVVDAPSTTIDHPTSTTTTPIATTTAPSVSAPVSTPVPTTASRPPAVAATPAQRVNTAAAEPCAHSTAAACGPVTWVGAQPTNHPARVEVRVVPTRQIGSWTLVRFDYRGEDPDGGLQPGDVVFGNSGTSMHVPSPCTAAAPTGRWTADEAVAARRFATKAATDWTVIDMANLWALDPHWTEGVPYQPGTYTARVSFDSNSCAGFNDVFASATSVDITFTVGADGTVTQ